MNGISLMLPFLQDTSVVQTTGGVAVDEEASDAFQSLLLQLQETEAEEWLLANGEALEDLQIPQSFIPLLLQWKDAKTEDELPDSLLESLEDWQAEADDIELEQVEALLTVEDMSSATLVQLLGNIQSLLQQLLNTDKPDTKGIAGKLLPLMEKWMQANQQTDSSTLQALKTSHLTEEEAEVLEALLSRYSKRQFFSGRNVYGENAGVTKADLQQWIAHIVPEIRGKNALDMQAANSTAHSAPMVMTVQEQHTIHMDEAVRVDRIGPELAAKLETIVRESNFMARGGQQLELSILLKPQHLGNMTLRFQQMDGEMTVKIIVSTHLAKESLESNMHQLKHLFSPHQIQVERNESVSDEEYYGDDQGDQEKEEELKDTEKEHQHDQEQQETTGEDFETILQTLREEGIL